MSQVNLLKLCVSKVDVSATLTDLEKLADSKEGPLRIEHKNGVPHLGIRTWKTYFFEKLVLDDLDIQDIERNTAETITSYVGTLVEEIEKQAKPKPASGAVLIPKTRALDVFARHVLFKLQAKASGKDLDPQASTKGWMAATMTRPGYRPEKVNSGTVRSHNGKVMVPKGLSIGIIPIENVIADARFLCPKFMATEDSTGQCRNLSMSDKRKKFDPSSFVENDYYRFYRYNLNQVGEGETSVAVQLVITDSAGSSEDNRNGAWRAADEFIKKRASAQNPVSVLLCTNNLPEVKSNPNRLLSISQSPRLNGTNADTDTESEYLV